MHYSWSSMSWPRTKTTILLNLPRLYVMPDGSIAKDFFKDKLPRADDVRKNHSYRLCIRTPTSAQVVSAQAPLLLSPTTSLASPPLPCSTYAAAIAFTSSAAGQYQTHQLQHLTLPCYPTVATYLTQETHAQRAKKTRLTIHLYNPEENEFARLFKSAYWIIAMQILIPLAGCIVSANAFAQILIER